MANPFKSAGKRLANYLRQPKVTNLDDSNRKVIEELSEGQHNYERAPQGSRKPDQVDPVYLAMRH